MIIKAKEKGYTATQDGKVFDKNLREIKGSPLKTSGHLRITLYADGVNKNGYCSVLKHRFIAYYFLGDVVFEHDLIRHKNDISDDNRIENLIPGSYVDNRRDIPREKLSAASKKISHLLIERSRKLENSSIAEMRELYSSGKFSYLKLSKLFNVSTMTAYRAVTRQSWKGVE